MFGLHLFLIHQENHGKWITQLYKLGKKPLSDRLIDILFFPHSMFFNRTDLVQALVEHVQACKARGEEWQGGLILAYAARLLSHCTHAEIVKGALFIFI